MWRPREKLSPLLATRATEFTGEGWLAEKPDDVPSELFGIAFLWL